MQEKKRKCCICSTLFTPHRKASNSQKVCEKPECKKIHKRNNNARWRQNNPDYYKDDYDRLKSWLTKHPGYLEQYRQEHPGYVQKNREAQKRRERHKKRHLDIQAKLSRQPSEIMDKLEDVLPASHLDIQDGFILQPLEITLFLSRFIHFSRLDIQAVMDFPFPLQDNGAIKRGGGAYGCKMAH
jgi:hypothetical protein